MKDSLLNIEKLSVEYFTGTAGKIIALKNLSLKIFEGDFITIIGNNASGKTTFFNSLTGSLKPSSGNIKFNGSSILKTPEFKRSRFISRVSQNPNDCIFKSMTIAENLTIAKLRQRSVGLRNGVKKKWRLEFIKKLKALGLGLEKRLDEKIDYLSGGQKQIVALLMATIEKPELLLLDEHTASLDPGMSKKVLKITNNIIKKNKITTLMITHDIKNAIIYGNRLILLKKGEIKFKAEGKFKRKLKIDNVLQKIFR